MNRRTSAIALTLLGAGTAGFIVSSAASSCYHNGYGGATTTRSGYAGSAYRASSGSRFPWWSSWGHSSSSWSSSSGSSSSSPGHSSSISRGGFGSSAAHASS